MKLNTGLTAFTLISSFCAGAEAGDSVTTATGTGRRNRKKVHLRGKATISDFTNPANPNSDVSANEDTSVGVEAESNQSNQPPSYSHSSYKDKDKGVRSPSKSSISIKTGYFENLPSLEETYGKFVGKYAVCKNMYTVAEGDVNDITLSSKQLGSSPLEGSKASYIEITNVNQTGETPFSFHAERRWGTATGLHDISYVGTASTAHNREVIQFYSYLNAEESQEGGFLDESDTMTCIKTGYSDITMVCDIVTNKQVDEAGIGKVLTEVWYLTGPVNPEDENDPCSSIRGVDRPIPSTIPDSSPRYTPQP